MNNDRFRLPGPQPLPDIPFPPVHQSILANGLRVKAVPQSNVPLVMMTLLVSTGSDGDPAGFAGTAALTSDLLDTGTRRMDALEISDRLEFLGSGLHAHVDHDYSAITITTLARHFEISANIFAEIATEPIFPEKEFERLKRQRLAALLQKKAHPAAVASVTFARILYGLEHPYGSDPSGRECSVRALQRRHVTDFYERVFSASNATLIAVGDTSLPVLTDVLGSLLSGWRGGVRPGQTGSPFVPPERSVTLVDRAGAAQSEIRIGARGPARLSPDFFPLIVMNRVLGGQFTSRVNLNLREVRGFTYGARTSFGFGKRGEPFTASAAVHTENTGEAVEQFFLEIEKMRQEGVSSAELASAHEGIGGSFALAFETPGQISSLLQTLSLHGLPDGYYADYVDNVRAVDREDILRVAREHLDPTHMQVVVVGDVARVRPQIEKLNLGKTVIVEMKDLDL